MPQGGLSEDRHSLDLNTSRTVGAVLIDVGDGFVAAGVQLSLCTYGAEPEDALQTFVDVCQEIQEGVCAQNNVDLAAVLGRGDSHYMTAAEEAIEERELPQIFIGQG